MINTDFKSLADLFIAFPNESSCYDHLEMLRWNGTVISPFDSTSQVYICRKNQFRCSNTGKYFNAKTQTLFYNSNISLQKWFIAIWLITHTNKNLTSIQLSKELNITQKSAWLMLKKISMYYEIAVKPSLNKKMKKNNKKINLLHEIDIVVENDKLKMVECLNLLKK